MVWTEVRVRLTYGAEEVWEEPAEEAAVFDYTVRSDGFLIVYSVRPGGIDRFGHCHEQKQWDAVYPPGAWSRVSGGTHPASRNPGLEAVMDVSSKPLRR